MELFLQIIGGIVVAVILLIVGIYVFLKLRFGKLMKLDANENYNPLLIHLNEEFSPSWMDGKEAQAIDGEPGQLGFVRGKSCSVPEMSGMRLTPYFKPSLTGVLYHHEVVGVWVEITVEDEAGRELTVTDGPMGEAVERPPEKEIEYLKGYSVSQLFE